MNKDMVRMLASDIGVELGRIETLLSEVAVALRMKSPLARRSLAQDAAL